MNKLYYLFSISLLSTLAVGQNALINGAVTGNPLTSGEIEDFEFAYDGTNLALVIGDYDTGKLHAVDYNASNSTGVLDWSTENVEDIINKIASLAGSSAANISIKDMEVNPKNNSVMILAEVSPSSDKLLIEVKSSSDIQLVDLTNVSYASVNYTANGNYIFDLEWGSDGMLYFCTGDFSLDAEVGYIEPPFTHNSTAGLRATSLFKSNWGGNYFTEAPLEMISMAKVDGVDRLMGVTTCAPGFSIPVSEIQSSSSLLSVTEDFNVHFDPSRKVVAVTQQIGGVDRSFLFDLHINSFNGDDQLIRIGNKYLNGSRDAAGETNNNAEKIRTNTSGINTDLSEEDAKLWSTGYEMIAKYDDYHLMVIDDQHVLRLEDISAVGVGVEEKHVDIETISLYPVPAIDVINLPGSFDGMSFTISSLEGRIVKEGFIKQNRIQLNELATGNYLLTISRGGKLIGKNQFNVIK